MGQFKMQYEISILLLCLIPILEACPLRCNCILTWSKDGQVKEDWHCGQQGLTSDKLDSITKDQNTSDVDVLYLTSNKIKNLDANKLKGFANLKTLALGKNLLNTIPTSLCQALPQLEVLTLVNNTIDSITSDSFTNCNNLRHLNLSGNKIHVLGESVFLQAKNLEELDLSGNVIHSVLSGSLNGLLKLQKFDISQNDITKIPDDMFSGSHNVQWVDLSNNRINSLTKQLTKHLLHAEKLYLGNNAIKSLEPGVFDGMKLQVLDLSKNEITILQPILFDESIVEKLLVKCNPLICSCNLKNIVRDKNLNQTKAGAYVYSIEGSCAFPKTELLIDTPGKILSFDNLTRQLNCGNDCLNNDTCQNNGQCLLVNKVGNYSYKCQCRAPFYGTYCELKMKTSKTLLVIVVIVIIPILVLIVGLILFRRQCSKNRRRQGDMFPLTDDDFSL